jgi:hypothetical protein
VNHDLDALCLEAKLTTFPDLIVKKEIGFSQSGARVFNEEGRWEMRILLASDTDVLLC